MTFKGFNFRQTLAYVTDGPNDVWADLTSNSYKSVADGGTGYGWVTTAPSGGNSNNLGATYDPRIAGKSTVGGTTKFRIDVPNGTYDIRFALRGTAVLTRYYCRIRVGAGAVAGTDYFDIDSGSSNVDVNHVLDANGSLWPPADWPANNTTLRVSVTQGYFQIEGSASSPNAISHFAYQEVVTPLADGVLVDDTNTAGTTPKLMEAQPDQKVLGFLSFTVGSDVDIDYSITGADGVTPDPYLALRTIGGNLAVCYAGARHPGTGPTRTFYITQTDKTPGKHANAPYIQAVTLDVVAAPTKPYGDGTLLARISTQAFLARKKVVDQLSAPYMPDRSGGLWAGYQGQSFVQQTTVYNTTQFKSTMAAMVAQAGANKWFCIEIDQDGTSDWTTGNVQQNGSTSGDWLFQPENGGGCLIRYREGGAKPQINGYFYMRCPRGVHMDGIEISNLTSHMFRLDGGKSAANDISLLKFSNMRMGVRFHPTYADATPSDFTMPANSASAPDAFFINGACEQFICVDSHISGVYDAFNVRARYMLTENNDVTYLWSDCHGCAPVQVADVPYYPGGDSTQYAWIKNMRVRAHINEATGMHSDFYQQRVNGVAADTYILCEDAMVVFSGTVDDSGASGQCFINSDSAAKMHTVMLNNIFCTTAVYGLQCCYGAGVTGYAEYNTLGMPGSYSANANAYVEQKIWAGAGGAVHKGRKNIIFATEALSEDDVFYDSRVAMNKDPNLLMTGPFIIDSTTKPAIPCYHPTIDEDPFNVPSVTASAFKAAMIAAFSPKAGIDAGYQAEDVAPPDGDVTFDAIRQGAMIANLNRMMSR